MNVTVFARRLFVYLRGRCISILVLHRRSEQARVKTGGCFQTGFSRSMRPY
jgi:hypothetical protein